MVPVARRNLFAEKGRFAISVGGVTFAVLLILVILGLYRGFEREAGSFVESVPGDLWVMEQDTTDIFHSFSVVSEDKLDEIRAVPGVSSVIPLYARRGDAAYAGGRADTYLMAFDVPPATEVLPGIEAPASGQIIVDSVFSRKTGLSVGDTLTIRGRDLTVSRVADISNVGLSQFSLISAADAKEIAAIPGSVNYVLAFVDGGQPAASVAQAIERAVPGTHAEIKADFAEANRNEIISFFLPIISVLLVIGFLVGTVVIGLTIYTATIERSREYGVMKAVGGSAGFLYRIVLSQSATLTAAGFVAGLLGSLVVADLAARAVPEFATDFQARDIAAVGTAALVMAVIASLVPARRVNSIDPAIVFRA